MRMNFKGLLRLVLLFAAVGAVAGTLLVPSGWCKEGYSVSGRVDCGGNLEPDDRLHCENVLLDAADDELNRAYQAVMAILDVKSATTLRTAQRAWLAYRDLNFESFSAVAPDQGQDGLAQRVREMRMLTKHRAAELQRLALLAVGGGKPAEDNSYQMESNTSVSTSNSTGNGTAAQKEPVIIFHSSGEEDGPADSGIAGEAGTETDAAQDNAAEEEPVESQIATPAPAPRPSEPEQQNADAPARPEPEAPESQVAAIEKAPKDTTIKSEEGRDMLMGRHTFRLQWLSSVPSGQVEVVERGGALDIEGVQGSGSNSMRLEGRVSTVRKDSFTVHGRLVTRVDYLNDGKPCVREGVMWFVRKSGRPFWRLQSITNPCTGVSDYIDISIRKER